MACFFGGVGGQRQRQQLGGGGTDLIGEGFDERWRSQVAGQVGLGCWALGGKGWGGQSDRAASAVLEEAWEAGYRHFDTAASYGFSERVLGEFLQATGQSPFIASKVYPGPNGSRIRDTVCRSLERLKLSRIDLYYLHWPRGDSIEADVEALAVCIQEGLVGRLGVSNYSMDQLCRAHRIWPVTAYQGPYSLLWRVSDECIIPICQQLGIAFVGYGALAEGLLAKSEVPCRFPVGDHRSGSWLYSDERFEDVKALHSAFRSATAMQSGAMAQIALKWALQREGVAAVLAGARRPGQALQNKTAEQLTLSEGITKTLDDFGERAALLSEGRTHYFGTHP